MEYPVSAIVEICFGGVANLSVNAELDRFLASVERRAFLIARTALGDQDDALDSVQDAMLLLVKKYGHKSEDEWRLLFFKILHNRIRDVIRRRTVKNRFTGWLPSFASSRDAEQDDPFQHVADTESNNPALAVERQQSMAALTQAVEELPYRQQQAFMLRCWEGLSTLETASVMGCSEGSVKTHYSRALHSLREQLEEHRND